MEGEIAKSIKESIEAQVKVVVAEWGGSNDTKKFLENLRSVVHDNDVLIQDAQVKLDNSRARHENCTLDEHTDFETPLSGIKLPSGNISEAFPRTLKTLFSYDEKQLVELFNDYHLKMLDSHVENLNRFLAFIGSRPLVQG